MKGFTDEQVTLATDVLTNAYECSSIDYWAGNIEVKRDDEDDETRVTELSFEELQEDGVTPVEPRKVYVLGVEQIIEAMRVVAFDHDGAVTDINIKSRHLIGAQYITNDYLAGEGGDSESDDMVVQVASFGKLVYS